MDKKKKKQWIIIALIAVGLFILWLLSRPGTGASGGSMLGDVLNITSPGFNYLGYNIPGYTPPGTLFPGTPADEGCCCNRCGPYGTVNNPTVDFWNAFMT